MASEVAFNSGTPFNIVPCELTKIPRGHLTRAYDGTPQKASFANETYGYEALQIDFWWGSCTAANMNTIEVASSAGTSVTITDSDTSSEYSVWTGLVAPPSWINSRGKNKRGTRPSITIMLTSVTQR